MQSIGDLFLIRVFRQADEDAFTADGNDDLEIQTEQLEGNDFSSTSATTSSSSSCCRWSTIERIPSRIVSSWVETSAKALQKQWPRQEREEPSSWHSEQPCKEKRTDNNDDNNDDDSDCNNADVVDCNYDYYRKMIVHHEQSSPCYSLACSYLLVQHKQKIEGITATTLLGHGRLAECYETAGGNAAAATYILIDPEWRGKGHGKSLLRLLELEANAKERLGCHYHFVYLWCKIATAPFYEQSGYSRCRNRVSLQRPCLKALAATSVQSLEEILRSRQQCHQQTAPVSEGNGNRSTNINTNTGNFKKKLETVVLLPSSSSPKEEEEEQQQQPVVEKDVWLRKRLVDHVESIKISQKDRTKEMNDFVVSTTNPWSVASSNKKGRARSPRYYYRWNPRVPWQMQIGPSCGLTAVRMVKDFYYSCRSSSKRDREQEHSVFDRSSLSLLGDAQKRGYTQDGEIFDANHLRELMEDQLLFGRAANGNFSLDNINNNNSDNDDNDRSMDSLSSLSVRARETSSLTMEEIDSTLRQGGLWILPYDSNPRTKLPDNMRGKRAHWGIIVGIVFSVGTTPSDDDDDNSDKNNLHPTIGDTTATQSAGATKGDRLAVFDDEILSTNRNKTQENKSSARRKTACVNDFASPLLIPLEDDIESTNDDSVSAAEKKMRSPQNNFDQEQLEHGTSTSIGCIGTSTRNVYWIIQHSLSSKWAMAPMDEWVDSNKQLVSVDHKFTLENEGGLNLKNRIIQILPVRNDALQPPQI